MSLLQLRKVLLAVRERNKKFYADSESLQNRNLSANGIYAAQRKNYFSVLLKDLSKSSVKIFVLEADVLARSIESKKGIAIWIAMVL